MQLSLSFMLRTITPMLIGSQFAMTDEDKGLLKLARDILRIKLTREMKVRTNRQLTPTELGTYVVDRANMIWNTLFP